MNVFDLGASVRDKLREEVEDQAWEQITESVGEWMDEYIDDCMFLPVSRAVQRWVGNQVRNLAWRLFDGRF